MTNQQGAPEALTLAGAVDHWVRGDYGVRGDEMRKAAAELRRLHAENERLAALVEAQQPAPSAAAAGEVPLPLLVRDIAADLGTTPIQVCTALAQLGFGGHSVNMAVTPRMAQSLRAHFASPTPQADSQPAPVADGCTDPYNCKRCMTHPSHRDGMEHAGIPAHAVARAARAPADSVTAPAGGVVAGPSKWTDEEIADGKRGIRWVTEGVIHGRPTDHDVREYLMRTPAMRGCLCDDCRTFYAPTPPAQAADPLQGAADWLAEAHGQFCVAVLQGCLMIGYNRAKRLHDAAIAARKQGVA